MASLQYTFIFGMLITEIAIFAFLLIPMPNSLKRSMHQFISKSPTVKSIMFYVKIIYGFVFFLFVDACQRLYRLSHQYESNNKGDNEGGSGRVVLDERTLSQVRANKFYAQRNFYLTGFTLLLGLILINTQSLLLEITSTKEEIKDLKKGKSDSSASQALDSHKYESTAEELKQLKKRTLDFDTLKKQLDSNQREYDRLSDEYAKLEKKYEAVVAGGDSSSVNAQERKKSN